MATSSGRTKIVFFPTPASLLSSHMKKYSGSIPHLLPTWLINRQVCFELRQFNIQKVFYIRSLSHAPFLAGFPGVADSDRYESRQNGFPLNSIENRSTSKVSSSNTAKELKAEFEKLSMHLPNPHTTESTFSVLT